MDDLEKTDNVENDNHTHTVLAVDDDPTSLMLIETLLENKGYNVITATNGLEAYEAMSRDTDLIDVVLIDREMPEMNGIEVTRRIKNDPLMRHTPIVMQTGSKKPEEIKQGIDAGVFYYLTKPFTDDVLYSIIGSAIREAQQHETLKNEMTKHRTSFSLLQKATFQFKKLDETEMLSCFLANCFPDPSRVLNGLSELMINALEHGNLNIGFENKSKLIEEGNWRDVVLLKQSLPENQNKVVIVDFYRMIDQVSVTITDQGSGFDWRQYMEVDPSRALENHGRGIAQAHMINFDKIEYNQSGNSVTATSFLHDQIDW